MIPEFAEQGSNGSGIKPLLEFLEEWASPEYIPLGFEVDEVLGDKGMALVALYQASNGLTIEGGCGPEMRTCLNCEDNFDFEAEVRRVGGVTNFVQPDGTIITWSPELEAESKVAADAVVSSESDAGKSKENAADAITEEITTETIT